ncbi:MAG: tetratricopeptide repeat protein [Acidobacteria bacterium]|nr:tetratricopeptide repeat protein [Acidobacteriota bacterium]
MIRALPAFLLAIAFPAAGTAAALAQGGAPDASRRVEAEYRSLLSRGAKAVSSEDYDTARELLERAVKLRPDSVPAHYQLGRALTGLKRLKPGAEQFELALKIEPKHQGALLGLASIDEGTGDFPGAERRYREALALGPNKAASRALASLLGRQGKGDEASAILQKLLAGDPTDFDTLFEQALAHAIQGDCAAAIPEFRRVVAAQPARVTALFQLGNCLSRTGHGDEAAEVLARFRKAAADEKARKEAEKKVHFALLEADSLAEGGKTEAAAAKVREALAADPGSASAHGFLGSLLIEMGRNGEALAELKRAAEIDPADGMALVEVGRLLALGGRGEEAIPYLKRAAAADTNAAEPHKFLAILYQQMGRAAEAEQEKAIYLKLARVP